MIVWTEYLKYRANTYLLTYIYIERSRYRTTTILGHHDRFMIAYDIEIKFTP